MIRDMRFGRRAARFGRPRSMLIFLHGYGADGADLLGLADALAPHLPHTVFIAPDAPEPCRATPFGRQWFPIPWMDGSTETESAAGLARSEADLNAFVDARMAEEGLPAAAVAVFGFSQGAMMALQVLPRRSAPVAGVIACSGRLLAPERLAAEAQVKPPVLLLHGDADPVVPFADMGRAGDALVAAGFDTYAHVMQGTGHGIAPDGVSVALAFLAEHLPR